MSERAGNAMAGRGRQRWASVAAMAWLLCLPACGGQAPDAPANGGTISDASTPASNGALPSAPDVAPPMPEAAPRQPSGSDFAPLQSAAVKDAIHRALRSGQAQRWQDGAWSGYAVPSTTTGANGCRAVRYTVDQRPDAPYGQITACDAH